VVEPDHVRPEQDADEVGRVGVGAEVDDRVNPLDRPADRVPVGQVADDLVGQPRRRPPREPAHRVTALEQVAAERLADRAGRAGHQHALRVGRALRHRSPPVLAARFMARRRR
jgi:hypothetical protein